MGGAASARLSRIRRLTRLHVSTRRNQVVWVALSSLSDAYNGDSLSSAGSIPAKRWRSSFRQMLPLEMEGIMASNEREKCAHPVCSCRVTEGKYCSPQCEAMEETPDIDCSCAHPGCKGKVHPAA